MAATRNMYVRNGQANPALSQTGALASGVPGALAAYDYAVAHFGRKKLRDLLLSAAALADQGFILDAAYARNLETESTNLAAFTASREVFLGQPLKAGARLRQPDLATTYRQVAELGTGWFYAGPFAKAVEKWMKANGGLLTAEDFAHYKIVLREPIVSDYRGWRIVGFPPPSSGGVHVAQILNVLEHFSLKSLPEATRLHVIAEAMKLAFADRAYWLGDPDFTPVPRGLLDKNYAAALAAKISLDRASTVSAHGMPPDWHDNIFRKHTTHFSVADAEGNWVACTATINTTFGSKVVVPGTGVILNNEMDDFSIQPGVTNYFGLLGAEANAVAPGKRPLSSMSPTIVLKDGKPILALGAAGGPTIISAVVMELVSMLDLGMSPAEAVAAPRIHHQWFPNELQVEKALPSSLQTRLAGLGLRVQPVGSIAVSQIVSRPLGTGSFTGAADPRAGGSAEGW
jgi:gamma-glutamyltranspeptidase/glutathione hydrolase